MVVTFQPPLHGPVLNNISWQTYESILHDLEGQRFRITYDQGRLEVMVVSYEHERFSELLGYFIRILTLELAMAMCSGGSTTFKKKSLAKGLEPDKCWWIQSEAAMRGRRSYDIDRDPPPDLAIEVEVTRSALDRMVIYAALKVPEVWRFDGATLHVHLLAANGKYRVRPYSAAFPFLPLNKVAEFLQQSETIDETTLLRSFTQWVRDEVAAGMAASRTKGEKNTKRSKRPNG